MDCEHVGGIVSPVSPSAAYDGLGSSPGSPNQAVPDQEMAGPVLGGDPSHEVPQGLSPDRNQETQNQEVPVGSANPSGENEPGFVLPDTPPDSQAPGDAPGGNAPGGEVPADAPAQDAVLEGDPATPRLVSIRKRKFC